MAWPATAPPPTRGGGALGWLRTTATLVRRRALLKRTPEDHRRAAATAPGGEMPRVLSRADLTLLSLGCVVGAGVFVLTGVAAADHGGPSVVLGYVLAGGAALLCALCYTECAASLPVAGGAVVFVGVVFGELATIVVAGQLLLEYVISAAAIARAASAYLGALCGARPGALLLHVGRAASLDFVAAALVVALAALLARGTRQSASVNATVTLVSLVAAAYTLAAGAPLARAANLTPFFADGARGVFSSAAIVFYAYVGFDAVATAAEEARDPAADLPFAIVASVCGAGGLYAALALVLVAAVPRAAIDHGAPFAAMFTHFAAAPGASRAARLLLATSAKFVAFGVVAGLLTAGLVTQLAAARVVVFLARERLLPPGLAAVDAATGAPAAATWATSALAAALALLVDVADLAALVSVGTLTALAAVAAAVLKRRHSPPGGGGRAALALAALFACSAAVSACTTFAAPPAATAAAALAWLAAALAFCALPVAYAPAGFRVPLAPLTPALAVLATVQLALALGVAAYIRLAVWTAACLAFYAAYSVRAADAADAAGGRCTVAALDGGDAVALELAVASGLAPPPRPPVPPPARGASADDRARLLTVVRLHSDDGLADPRTPHGSGVPPSPVASDGGASSVGVEAVPRVPSRLSQ